MKLIGALKYLMFLIIPILSVLVCVGLRLAQGEQNEELVFGMMVGIALDLIYAIVLAIHGRK